MWPIRARGREILMHAATRVNPEDRTPRRAATRKGRRGRFHSRDRRKGGPRGGRQGAGRVTEVDGGGALHQVDGRTSRHGTVPPERLKW